MRAFCIRFSLTDAPLAPAVELGALQVIVVTMMTGEVLVVVVVLVVLGLLDNIVSRTSSKQKAATLMMSHRKEANKQHIQPINRLLITAAASTALTVVGGWM